ncbi:MAG: hypothetical protein ACFHVJ_16190 [Aestuariibacter sp.]
MKYTGLLGLIILLSAPLHAAPQEKKYSLSLSDPSQPVYLDVEMHNGSIHIIGYEGKTVEITALLSPLTEAQVKERKKHHHNGPKVMDLDKPKRSMEGLKPVKNVALNLEIEEQNNRVEIESERGSYNVTLVVQIPQSAQVEVDLHDGDFAKLENISGAIEVQTWRGNIEFINIHGPVVAETHGHDIIASFASFDESSPSSFTTFSGDIDVTLSRNVAMKLNLRNYQGEILSGLESEFTPVDSVDKDNRRDKQKIVLGAQLSTQINGGNQALTLNSYSGDMYLRKTE